MLGDAAGSPATTLAARMASSSDVLPWSTWPMIGDDRADAAQRLVGVGRVEQASSTSDLATRLTVWPNSPAISFRGVGVDHVGDLVHLAPGFIRNRMTSTPRSDMRLASSWIVIVSGTVTSRDDFSFWLLAERRVRRWTCGA